MHAEQRFLKRQAELSSAKQALLEKRLKQLAGKPDRLIDYSSRSQADMVPLSFAQQRLWFLQQLEPESPAYNEAIATLLRGPLDLQAFNQTARTIIGRHDVLRCRFPLVDGKVVQVIDNEVQNHFTVSFEDMRTFPPQSKQSRFSGAHSLRCSVPSI